MKLDNIPQLKDKEILAVINLDDFEFSEMNWKGWIEHQVKSVHRIRFEDNQCIVFVYVKDHYRDTNRAGMKLTLLQEKLNQIDISNFFCYVVSTNPELQEEITLLRDISSDPVPLNFINVPGKFDKINGSDHRKSYVYASPDPIKVSLESLDPKHRDLLVNSKTFCIYPWMHLHAWPTGEVFPCCAADSKPGPLGSTKKNTLKEVWNGDQMKQLRTDMLSEKRNDLCIRCYEKEETGFFSERLSANKHHGHHISKIDETLSDGTYQDFSMSYWDIRFSNLCNLRCRSCGYIFSSQWWKDQKALLGQWGEDWGRKIPVLNFAGRSEDDIWTQLIPHFDYVEQIYFAGGEPLIMEEHYRILEELVRRKKFDVRLIYNTNFTEVKLKDKLVFEYWKLFDSVAVGASLDAMGTRAEYIRKGTDWHQIEENRKHMIEICPEVDFYISPTLSIMNAYHIADFHRSWTDKGLIRAQDINVNILQDPLHYRIDIATAGMKNELEKIWKEHLAWLEPQDRLMRASNGFKSAINFLHNVDNSHLISTFWQKTDELDKVRGERLLDIIPELEILR